MNTDIRLSVGFWQHPKTKKTAKRLGIEGVRSLQVLWLWAAVNRPDGSLSGMDWEDIELAADWQGNERAFFDHCLGVWLDDTPDGYALHDWQDHNTWAAQVDDREDKARFSRLAQVNREAYDRLKGDGINAISKDDYEALCSRARRRSGDATATPRKSSGDATAIAGESLAPSETPAPAPAPSPALTQEERENTASAPPLASPDAEHVLVSLPVGGEETPPLAQPPDRALPETEPEATPTALDIPPSRPRSRKQHQAPPEGEPCYRAKHGRYLAGARLASFDRFWAAFDFAKGKADAADAWLDIPQLTDALVDTICHAAALEARRRIDDTAKGKSPKWAQGWLTSRRWEDYEPKKASAQAASQATPLPRNPTPEELEENRLRGLRYAQQMRERGTLSGEASGLVQADFRAAMPSVAIGGQA